MNWRYIRQKKHTQIEIDIICENSTQIDYNFNIGNKVMVRKNQAYKYETLFQGPYKMVQMWTNITFTRRIGEVTPRINIHCIKPYDSPKKE